MNIQERILEVLEKQGSVRVADIGKWIQGYDNVALDCALNALMRANRVSRGLGRYELVRSPPGSANRLAAIATACAAKSAPPTAAEEAAASLQPKTRVCGDCELTKDVKQFQVSPIGTRSSICTKCHGERTSAGRAKKKEKWMENSKPATQPAGPVARCVQVPLAPASEAPVPKPAQDSVIERMRQRQSAIANQMQALQVEASELEQALGVFGRFAAFQA